MNTRRRRRSPRCTPTPAPRNAIICGGVRLVPARRPLHDALAGRAALGRLSRHPGAETTPRGGPPPRPAWHRGDVPIKERTSPEKKREDPGPSVKDPDLYEKLRDEGDSKEKAARIANAAANSSREEVGRKGGEAGSYEDMTLDELMDRAKEIGIDGRSTMNKDELIKALREH